MRDILGEGCVYFPGVDGGVLYAAPTRTISARSIAEVLPALQEVRAAVAAGIHAAGFVAYEAAPAFDNALSAHPPQELPLLWFGLYDAPSTLPFVPGSMPSLGWEEGITRADYNAALTAIREAIAAGNTYQVNHTWPLRAHFDGDPATLFAALYGRQPTRYGAYIDTGRFAVCSVSPELFFQLDGDRIITEPMKGTAKRGRYLQEDLRIRDRLGEVAKERAENLMIVDLLRNDLGRIASSGTVAVEDLFATQRLDTVWQMTSRISAETRADVPDVFSALFPSGSVTGAPKVQTSRIIHQMEPQQRGVYCGAIGWWRPGRQACFSVAIRTATVDRERAEAVYPVGSGVTWDALAEAEFSECRQKAAVLFDARPEFELLETLLHDGAYYLLDRHLTRMGESAAYFGYAYNEQRLRAELAAAASQLDGPHRVRLVLARDGSVRIESSPFSPAQSTPFRLALAQKPVSSSDIFLFHKTTHRAVYEEARATRPDVDDVLLWNERDEITETTIGNIVIEIDGRRLTPARDCGLLPGTLRAELLDAGEIAEAVLTKPILRDAEQVWMINSVRGWVRASLEFGGE